MFYQFSYNVLIFYSCWAFFPLIFSALYCKMLLNDSAYVSVLLRIKATKGHWWISTVVTLLFLIRSQKTFPCVTSAKAGWASSMAAQVWNILPCSVDSLRLVISIYILLWGYASKWGRQIGRKESQSGSRWCTVILTGVE